MEKSTPYIFKNIHPAIILIIVHKKSKKLLMTVLTVAPTTKAKKQQTNELSSILSRYLIKTSFTLITPFMDYCILRLGRCQEICYNIK